MHFSNTLSIKDARECGRKLAILNTRLVIVFPTNLIANNLSFIAPTIWGPKFGYHRSNLPVNHFDCRPNHGSQFNLKY